MKIFINKDTDFNEVRNLTLKRLNEEDVIFVCESGYKLTEDQMNELISLPNQVLEVVFFETDHPDNYSSDSRAIFQWIYRLHNDNWKDMIDKMSERDYYQGFDIEIDIDTLNPETLVDDLIYFYEKLGLYRNRTIHLNITGELSFEVYNTFVAFMSEEMGNVCIWKHINYDYISEENSILFGLNDVTKRCNTHCMGMINGNDFCMCEYYKDEIISNINDVTTGESRKKLMESYRRISSTSGCGRHA